MMKLFLRTLRKLGERRRLFPPCSLNEHQVEPNDDGLPRTDGSPGGWFAGAVRRAGIPRVTPHDDRHTAASLASSSGATAETVQRMLGHKSAALTLDVCADLFKETPTRSPWR